MSLSSWMIRMKKTLFAAAVLAGALFTPLMAQAQDAAPPQANTVPEPESLVLVAMALGVAAGLRVRRSSQRARKDESRRDGE